MQYFPFVMRDLSVSLVSVRIPGFGACPPPEIREQDVLTAPTELLGLWHQATSDVNDFNKI